MREGAGGVFNFAVDGVALVSAAIEGGAGPPKPAQIDTPLHLVPDDGRGELILGAAVMANTAAARAARFRTASSTSTAPRTTPSSRS